MTCRRTPSLRGPDPAPRLSFRTWLGLDRDDFERVHRKLTGRELTPADWRDRMAYGTGCRRRIAQCGTWEAS